MKEGVCGFISKCASVSILGLTSAELCSLPLKSRSLHESEEWLCSWPFGVGVLQGPLGTTFIQTLGTGTEEAYMKQGLAFVSIFNFVVVVVVFLALHPQHMEVPRLGVQSELQLPACATATAMPDSSRICDLHHSSQQRQIPNPLSKAMDTSRVRYH